MIGSAAAVTLPGGRVALYAGLLSIVALVYGRGIDDPFHFDDMHSIVHNTNLRSLADVPRYFVDPGTFSVDSTLTMYRPLLLTTYAVNFAVSGTQAWSYHAVNIVVHGAVVIAVFEVLLLLLGSPAAAALGALLFGVHPVHSEAVYYVSSRSESLAALFVLVALFLHLSQPMSRRALVAAGAVAAFAAGLLTKSTAIVFLPLVLLVDVLIQPDRWRQRWKQHATYAVVTAGYLAFIADLLRRATLSAPVRAYSEQLWSQVKGVVYYLHLLAIPRALSVDHQFQLSEGVDRYSGSALLLLGSVLAVAFIWRSSRPLLLLLALWFLLALAPASVVPLNVIVNEHRIYLSGFAVAAGGAWLSVDASRPAARTARRGLWVVVLVFALLAMLRGGTWDSAESLWLDAVRKGPDMARPRFVLGDLWSRQGRTADAAAVLEKGLQRDPDFAPGYRFLTEVYLQTADLEAATATARRGVERLAREADLWALLAEVSRARALEGSTAIWFERSASAYDEALSLDPDVTAYHDNIGNILQELQRPHEALPHHLRAVELDPTSAASRLNLGNALRMLGRYRECEAAYLTAVEIHPRYAEAWLNLAALYEQNGAVDRAAAARVRARAAASEAEGR